MRILWRARSLASIARTTINGPGWIVDRLSFLILRLILFLPFRRTTSQWRRNCASFSRGQVNEVKTIRRLLLSLSAGGKSEYCIVERDSHVGSFWHRWIYRWIISRYFTESEHLISLSIGWRIEMKNWERYLYSFFFFFLLQVLFKYVIQWKRNCTLLLL